MSNTQDDGAKRIAANVRAETARRGISLASLGPVLGMKRGALYRRVHGDVPYTTDELAKVADFLGVPVSTLWHELGATSDASASVA